MATIQSRKQLMNKKHGFSSHPLHHIWLAMKRRCYEPSDRAFRWYGAVGVVVCDEWVNDFSSFYDWAITNGWRKGLHLDKDKFATDKTGKMYSPQYCSFIHPDENKTYTKGVIQITHDGLTMGLKEWCDKLNVKYGMIYQRVRHGWPFELAISTPKYGFYQENFVRPKGKTQVSTKPIKPYVANQSLTPVNKKK